MAAVNLLLDCTCTMGFAAADLGGGESYSGSYSFGADKVSLKESVQQADHSNGQELYEFARKTKQGFTVNVECKLDNSSLLAALRANDLGRITVTAPSGFSFVASGLILDIDYDYAGPSTMKFSLQCRGASPTFS